MFDSMKEHPDLIFNDATVQLIPIKKSIIEVLGKDLIAMLYRTDDRLCNKCEKLAQNKQIILLFAISFLFNFFLAFF